MTKHVLRFLQYNRPKPNGDRATRDTDCYDFEVRLNGKLLRDFTQFNPFYCHVNDYDLTFREVRNWVDDLADILGIDRPNLITMVKREVHEVTWVASDEA